MAPTSEANKVGRGIILHVDETGDREIVHGMAESLCESLQKIGVELEMVEDSGDLNVEYVLETIKENYDNLEPTLGENGSFWLVISSHGRYKEEGTGEEKKKYDYVTFYNGTLTVYHIAKKLREITQKPTVLIVQACRGKGATKLAKVKASSPSSLDGGGDPTSHTQANSYTKQDDKMDDKVTEEEGDEIPAESIVQPQEKKLDKARNEIGRPDVIPLFENQILLYATTPGNVSKSPILFDSMRKVIEEEPQGKLTVENFFTKAIKEVASDRSYNNTMTPIYYSMLLGDIVLSFPEQKRQEASRCQAL